VERSKVKVSWPLNAVNENQPYLPNAIAAHELQTWCMDGARRHAPICAMTSKRKALDSCSIHRLQGAGAYRSGRRGCLVYFAEGKWHRRRVTGSSRAV